MATILIVDDDEMIRATVRKILEKDGHVSEEAANGAEALISLDREEPEVLISDIYMPEMDGIEFLIRVRESHPALKIIAMSGGGYLGADDVLEMAGRLGAHAVLSKPFTIDDVRETLQEVLAGDS